MANQPDKDGEDKAAAPPGMPRWVKVLGIVAVLVIAVLVAVLFVVGGDHGPGRHGLEHETSAALSITITRWG